MLLFSVMKSLLIATTNPAKFEEISSILSSGGLEILGLKDFSSIQIVPETGDTFFENAFLKAKGYFEQTGLPCVADDGGLMVDYFDGAPGVNSHRWLGYEATDQELAEAILKKLEGVPLEKRAARIGGLAVFYDGEHVIKEENYVEGYIAERLMGTIKPGFPYRPIFIVSAFNKPFSMLTEEEDHAVGARQKNFRALKPKILELL